MKRNWLKLVLGAVAGILAVLAVGYYFAFGISAVPQTTHYKLDLAEIRRLARSSAGKLPTQVNSLDIARISFPHAMVIAGGGWGPHSMFMGAFQVMYADGAIVVDTAYSKAAQETIMPGRPYSPERWDQLQKAMTQAKAIVFTHEHPDHVGGVASAPDFSAIRDRIVMTQEQAD